MVSRPPKALMPVLPQETPYTKFSIFLFFPGKKDAEEQGTRQ